VLYRILKVLVGLALGVYFRRIDVYHRERIPEGRPVILAGNHPSAFLDAMIPAVRLRQILYFLVRGDIYGNRFVRRVLFAMHTLPIFRFRDGFRRMRANQETFDRCYQILEGRKNPVLIMAEGGNSERKRLLPLQKGAARLAFGARDAKDLDDLVIVPFGVNYTNVWRFRSQAMLDFGEPLYLKDYLEVYAANPRAAVTQLTRDLEQHMRQVVVQIDDPEDEAWANPLLDIAREGEGSEGALDREFARVRRINQMTPEEKEACKTALSDYQSLLKTFHPASHIPHLASRIPHPASRISHLASIIPFSLAWLLNAPPILFTHWLIKKLVPSPVFFTSIRLSAGIFIWLGYWGLGMLGIWGFGNLGVWFVGMLGIWVLGWYSLPFFERFSEWLNMRKVVRLEEKKRNEILAAREKLLVFFD
jgi:1-acyl-sn-glycerol-3-phosphate acyltransferase